MGIGPHCGGDEAAGLLAELVRDAQSGECSASMAGAEQCTRSNAGPLPQSNRFSPVHDLIAAF